MTTQPSHAQAPREAERGLIAQVLKGDVEAFSELLKSAEQKTFQAIYGIVGSREETEDILQEAALKAYRALPTFENRSSFSTWFYRIGINLALEKVRKKSSQKTLPLDETFVAEEDWSRNPEILTLSKELGETLESAIRELPEEYRVVLILKDQEELSNQEIADYLGESVAAVKSRLHRSRLYVRQKVEGYIHGGR